MINKRDDYVVKGAGNGMKQKKLLLDAKQIKGAAGGQKLLIKWLLRQTGSTQLNYIHLHTDPGLSILITDSP